MNRHSMSLVVWFVCGVLFWLTPRGAAQDSDKSSVATPPPPNVILIMSDDQGIGDFGCMGNPRIQTPNLDAMHRQSVTFSRFYVCPVCSPTRAGLMTGRYHYRTGVVDTWYGRSMMSPDETTLAERFQAAGYATGIFGKWHLGDNYPMRAMDQGFERSVVHRGGGIGQSSDPLGAEGNYTDPVLFHNGRPVQESGYCTDVYYRHAIEFIDQCQQQERPFFIYLPDNCPHGPFDDVPPKWYETYRQENLASDQFPIVSGGEPIRPNRQTDRTARIFAMISNLDANIGRLNDELRARQLWDNTIVIFLTDNGPNGERFTCGYKGRKTSVHEGGMRTLFQMQWPAQFKQARTVDQLAGYIDVTPTLIDLCGLDSESGPELDGVSLAPLLKQSPGDWETTREPIFMQVHRGNQPQRFHHFAVCDHRWKLVHPSGFGREQMPDEMNLELYDLQRDPFEQDNVIDDHPQEVARLKSAYQQWFDRVGAGDLGQQPARIVVSPQHENPLVLTRQDIRRDSQASKDKWATTDGWLLSASELTGCQVRVHFSQAINGDRILAIGGRRYRVLGEGKETVFEGIQLPPGDFSVSCWAEGGEGTKPVAAHQLVVSYPQRPSENRRR